MLFIVGLGDGTRQTLTLGGLETLKKCSRCILQTDQVPVAEELKKQKIEYETLDFLYDSCANFDQFIDQAVAYLLEKPEEDTCFGYWVLFGRINVLVYWQSRHLRGELTFRSSLE